MVIDVDLGRTTIQEFGVEVDNLYREFEGDEAVRDAANRILTLVREYGEFSDKAGELNDVLTILTGTEKEAAEAADRLLASEADLDKQRKQSIRQARSSLKEVAELQSQTVTLAQRYFEQVSRGAAQGDIQRTAGAWSQVVDRLAEARERTLEMFRAVFANLDPTNDLLRTTRAEIANIISELENAIALGEQNAARPFAEFFSKQVQFLRAEAQKVLSDISNRRDLGLAPDFDNLERARQITERAVERARQAVAVYQSIPNKTEEIIFAIADLNRFIATSTAELRNYHLEVAQTQLSQLESLISTLEEQRRAQRLSGDFGNADITSRQLADARKHAAYLRGEIAAILVEFDDLTPAMAEFLAQLREAQRLEPTEGLRSGLADAQAEIQQLIQLRDALQQVPIQSFGQLGEVAGDLDAVNERLAEAIDRALELARALAASDPAVAAVVAQLERMQATAGSAATSIGITFKQISELASTGLASAFDEYAQAVANGEASTRKLGDAFRRFASDFLRQIAQMIIQQTILNALQGIGGGGGFLSSLFHEGGIAGGSAPTRFVPAYAFANAFRYQTGGFAGFSPGEVPAILHRGEEVLPMDDPRHAANRGGGTTEVRVINAFDAASFLDESLQERQGQETVLNFVRANRRSIRSALEL